MTHANTKQSTKIYSVSSVGLEILFSGPTINIYKTLLAALFCTQAISLIYSNSIFVNRFRTILPELFQMWLSLRLITVSDLNPTGGSLGILGGSLTLSVSYVMRGLTNP